MYVNDQAAASFSDPEPIPSGSFALTAFALGPGGAEALFDNLQVWLPAE